MPRQSRHARILLACLFVSPIVWVSRVDAVPHHEAVMVLWTDLESPGALAAARALFAHKGRSDPEDTFLRFIRSKSNETLLLSACEARRRSEEPAFVEAIARYGVRSKQVAERWKLRPEYWGKCKEWIDDDERSIPRAAGPGRKPAAVLSAYDLVLTTPTESVIRALAEAQPVVRKAWAVAPDREVVERPTSMNAPALFWNMWATDADVPTYESLPAVVADTRYSFVVEVSPYKYEGFGARSRVMPDRLNSLIADWIATPGRAEPGTRFRYLVIPDEHFVEVPFFVEDVFLDFKKIQQYRTSQPTPPVNPMKVLHDGGGQEFVFSHSSFNLQTKPAQPGDPGGALANVTVLVWSPSGRPLDEVTFNFCLLRSPGVACPSGYSDQAGGVNTLLTGQGAGVAPDAVLHFFSSGQSQKLGAIMSFKESAPKFFYWKLTDTAPQLKEALENVLIPRLSDAKTEAELEAVGRLLFDRFFPTDINREAREARAAFTTFLRRQQGVGRKERPLVAVRLLGSIENLPIFVPLPNLVAYDERGALPIARKLARWNVDLPVSDAAVGSRCIDQWRFVLAKPMSDAVAPNDALKIARDATLYASRVGSAERTDSNLAIALSSGHSNWEWSWPDFRAWITRFGLDRTTRHPMGLVVLSHQRRNELSVTPEVAGPSVKPSFSYLDVQTRLMSPSVVVLASCESQTPSASELVRRFNENGATVVIGSDAKLDASAGGALIRCLYDRLRDIQGPMGESIGDVFEDAVECVANTRVLGNTPDVLGPPIRLQAQKLTLLGNYGVRVCAPVDDTD